MSDLPTGYLAKKFIAKEVPSCNHVIFGGFLFLEARKAYYSETLFAKCHTLSVLSNAYKAQGNKNSAQG